MMQRLKAILFRSGKPAARQSTSFNGLLLDQTREAVFVSLHRIGNLR